MGLGRMGLGYFEETGFIDMASGILIVQEAGGFVIDWLGRGPEIYERTYTLIVANAATQVYLIERLRGVPPIMPHKARLYSFIRADGV
ncbi:MULTISPECIES: FIG domain-containing protein [unclassified Rhizobium]|uniref:inositol monophosphatase family protein n=1 Tax=unclassified Rhizobium TaxID=2613769 RepID=UPI00214B1073|nr:MULTISPECIES: inositol monophosphatase family protein [unclassified Rhizobium]